VQGTFEFEVQPLREYFAARHLYVTAPYAPSGSNKRGTLPDRFDGIAPSPYWLNVTRFFSGCFDKGELPCLVDRLKFLSEQDFKLTNHPKRLAATLLSDWVFSEDQRSTRAAIQFVIDEVGIRHPLAGRREWQANRQTTFSLPSRCGREELVSTCFTILSSDPKQDMSDEILSLLRVNATDEENESFWRDKVPTVADAKLQRWIGYGDGLGVLRKSDLEFIDKVSRNRPFTQTLAGAFLRGGRADFLLGAEERIQRTVEGILSEVITPQRQQPDPLSLFSQEIDVRRYSLVFQHPIPHPVSDLERAFVYGTANQTNALPKTDSPSLNKCYEFIQEARTQSERLAVDWAHNLEPWTILTEKSRSLWGEQLINLKWANLAASIKSTEETYQEFPDLLDHEKPLCERVRYARLRAGNRKWWSAQFTSAKSKLDKILVGLTFISWASVNTISKVAEECSAFLDGFSDDEWTTLNYMLWRNLPQCQRSLSAGLSELPETLSDRLVVGLGHALEDTESIKLYTEYLGDYSGNELSILVYCAEQALRLSHKVTSSWTHALYCQEVIPHWNSDRY